MTMIRRALRDNGMATTVLSTSAVSSTLLLLGHVVSGMLSLETKIRVVLFISWGLLLPLQSILVGKRRCSGHWLVQYTAMAAYYLSTPLMFYVVHAACSASHFDESFPVTMSLIMQFLSMNLNISPNSLIIHSSHFSSMPFVSNMRVYSLRDGPQDHYRFVLSAVYLACLQLKWTQISSANRGIMMQGLHAVSPDFEEWVRNNLGLVALLLNMSPHFLLLHLFLFAASNPPNSTLDYETKAVAEYMKTESSMSRSPFFDDQYGGSLQVDHCRYPFMQRWKDGQWISIRDLSQRADLSKEDQDICLSYSLCRLLARRYYGFLCAEEGDAKVRRFALAQLGRDGYKRAFTNVEVQLAFLHDYFFTTSLRIVETSSYVLSYKIQKMAEWPSPLCIVGLLHLVMAVVTQNHWIRKEAIQQGYGPYLLYAVQMIGFLYMLIMPQERHLAIYWRPIQIAFHKLDLHNPTTFIWDKFLKRIFRSPNELDVHRPSQTQTRTVYWRDKIGQYSVLLDYDRRRSRKKELVAWFLRLVQPQPWYSFVKHHPVEEEDVRVPDSVRKLVAHTLRFIDGPPTNGTRSLKINMDSSGYDWSWTCRQQTHTGTILIWHIATCYCDMSLHHSDRLEEEFPLLVETETFHKVATALSRYCAYLVAFLPEFLPERSLITKEVFQNVIQDAQHALGSMHMEVKEKHTKIRGIWLQPKRGQTTFHKGIMLGRQLEKLNTRLRWKVMAEFWAETILYIAPSDNAEAHIEHLAKGGEFITHLWAMLSNAGILKRATEEQHPPPTSTTTGELCSSCRGPLTQTNITNMQTQTEITNVHSNEEAPGTLSLIVALILHMKTQTEITNVHSNGSHRGQPSKYTAEKKESNLKFRSINKV